MSYWGNEYMPGMRGATEALAREFANLYCPGETVRDCDDIERPKSDLMDYIRRRFDEFDEDFEFGDDIGPAGGYEFELLRELAGIYTDIILADWA